MNIIPQKLLGDSRVTLKTLPEKSFQLCITSPPYWGLRSYLSKGHPLKHLEIGSEPTIDLYITHLLEVFAEVWRALRDDGTLVLNMGDAYNSIGHKKSNSGYGTTGLAGGKPQEHTPLGVEIQVTRLKHKDLIMMPARVAMALQANGWYLRSMIPWIKRNCLSGGAWVYVRSQKGDMPMMVRDMARLSPESIKLWNGEKWTQVVDIYKADKVDFEFEIEIRSGERIGCTPDHRWPTVRGLIHARDLKAGDILKRCQLPQRESPLTPSRLPDDQIGYLCGLYLAEGFIGSGRVVLCGHRSETPFRVLALTDLVHSFHGTMWASVHDGNAETLHISCPALTAIVQDYIKGNSAKTKCLGTKCWQRSDEFLRSLMLGYLQGDGHRDKENEGRWRLGFCANDYLARDLRTVCARIGMEIRLRRGFATAKKGGKKHPIWRGEIRITRPPKIANGFRRTSDAEVVAIRKSRARNFYDVEVADEPHLFSLASGLLTHNSMPESVTDRPATATEYLFLFSKSERYFWDRHAIMMPVSANTNARVSQAILQQQMGGLKQEAYKTDHAHGLVGKKSRDRTPHEILKSMAAGVGRKAKMPGPNSRMLKDRDVQHEGKIKNNASFTEAVVSLVSSRNRRNTDWFMESWQGLMLNDEGEPLALVVNPKGTTIQHFASYPPKLVEPFVKACTSERGCCADCGTPWAREIGQQSTGVPASGNKEKRWGQNHTTVRTEGQGEVERHSSIPWEYQNYSTLGWRPNCECHGKLTRGKAVIPARISKDDAAVWGADSNGEYLGLSTKDHIAHGVQDASDIKARIIRNATEDREVEGWIYQSEMPLDQHPVKPCAVLDPFGGTSTTAEVCTALGRHSTVSELNPAYFEAARQRDSQSALALL